MSEPQHEQHPAGPVFHGAVSGSQFAWNNQTVTQNQQNADGAAPGFEALAALVTDLLRELPRVGLAEQDRADTEEAAREVLATITEPTPPEAGRLRRALAVLKGVLAPVATGVAVGTAAGAQDWARTAIEGLTSSL
ncbi:hypothetical protein ACFU90_21000 [Streptomyces noursei]|uniref:Uncharacterized protein n=1 Tax=Streptomyces noursei TaxID=1971 RepID=A0A401QWW8_STRNR|nr:hypothetical protein [Streptomyces noursei]AKA02596.1 hypothetical protein SAZ_09325 [Streptomyces noursei ZPM]EOT01474.1 hypothetical protein K530_23618 [Streptomyces noursei CCRC 11814]EXU90509.1 hypothetical protein P354_14270 [Streptomyces noursei PD-1]UWS71105.1 hypothetical protein N1H47_07535 [Streptomyces noursei]GCB89887.1 hypothetical protein SALB_02580 [Streptomyces noursei]